MPRIIDGRAIARKIKDQLAKQIQEYQAQPCFHVIQVGEHPASTVYVKNKLRACQELGIQAAQVRLPEAVSAQELYELVQKYNETSGIHGFLVQLPLPEHIKVDPIIEAIEPYKDVDGFHPLNVGRVTIRSHVPYLHPCTPWGIAHMLDTVYPKQNGKSGLQGKRVVVIGQSMIVGRPLSIMLQNDGATVVMCDKYTQDLAREMEGADVVVSGTGVPGLITPDLVRAANNPDLTVVDAGIVKKDGKIVGDAHPDIYDMVGAITPVPGGVGPVTIAFLLRNILKAYCIQNHLPILEIH